MFHENFCILEIDYLINQCSKIMEDKVWIRLKQLVLKFQMRLYCLTALTYITFNLFQQQNNFLRTSIVISISRVM